VHGRQLNLKCAATLLEIGGNNEKHQKDEQDVDHRNDRHLGTLALNAVKMHGRGQSGFPDC
jgi:hypothetical protein